MARPESANQPVPVDRRLVEEQLERILTSPLFARSESLSRLLRHIVELGLAGQAAGLREYSLGVDVFERGESFDPRCDTIVRVQARKLRARLDEYYRSAGLTDLVEIRIAKGGYVPVFRKRELPETKNSVRTFWRRGPAIAALVFLVPLTVWLTNPLRNEPANQRTSSEAQDQYRKARYWWAKGGVSSVKLAIPFYQKAITIDPSFADAYAGLSTAYGALGDNDRAAEMASRGIRVNAKSSKAHAALALALLRKWNWSLAEAEARRGVQLDSGDPATYHILANVMMATGRTRGAILMIRQAHNLEPLSWRHSLRLAEALVLDRDYTHAIGQFRDVLDIEPDFKRAWLGLAVSLTLAGNHLEASRTLQRHGSVADDDVLACSALIAARQGDGATARRLLVQLERKCGDQSDKLPNVASVYAALSDPSAALYYLNRAADVRLPSLPETLHHPMFDSVRSHPRFGQLLKKMNAGIS